jgi:hypothetical protein
MTLLCLRYGAGMKVDWRVERGVGCRYGRGKGGGGRGRALTLIPSCEKHGGTAELSSSASSKSIGNFSTADIGMSPL